MSKVQCPKSGEEVPSPKSNVQSQKQDGEADIEPSTFDIRLSVSDLRKSFCSPTGERLEVLRGVSFSAVAGESVAIMGASGAGKSTFLQLLGGLERPDHGSILAGEFAIEQASEAALARFQNESLGFVFQFHHLLPDLTAAENVSLPLRVARVNAREAMRRAEAMLKEVGFDKRLSDSVVGHLSGGEQQRVAVCRALVARPALVLADEPTGNLDAAISDQIARSLVSYARDKRALVLIATHNEAVAGICDRRLVLKDGRLSATESHLK